ncbi:MAG: hypothetical protein ABIJ59_07905 [Pseudomonadota bacterium]
MTNINHINESGSSLGTPQAMVGKNQKTKLFQNVLNQALDAKETPEMKPSPATGGLEEISSIGPALTSLSDMISAKTGKLLDMLEAYSSKLDDPNISLKSIAPVLEQIKANAGNLEQEAKTLTENQASLKDIVTQTIVAAQTEYFKFQRGDYLS